MKPALRKYSRYLEDRMLAASTIESYLNRVKLFLCGLERMHINQPDFHLFVISLRYIFNIFLIFIVEKMFYIAKAIINGKNSYD